MKIGNKKQLIQIGAMATIVSGIYSGNAQAHRRDLSFTYDLKQPSKGEVELESHTT